MKLYEILIEINFNDFHNYSVLNLNNVTYQGLRVARNWSKKDTCFDFS